MESRGLRNREQFKALHPLFFLPGRDEILQALGGAGGAALIQEADEIVKGKVKLFEGEPVSLRLSFDQPLRHWTEYELHPELLSPLYPPIPDVKFIWEPARFGWAFTLGRAYVACGEDAYADAFWKSFERFAEGNPPYLGPHWMNGQEVAMRMMALIWAAQVFDGAASSTDVRRTRLIQSIAVHAMRIPPTLIYARSQNNNHLVVEAGALFTAGVALDNPQWRNLGWSWLNRALERQISGYGEYIQHSLNYHRLMLQTALWVHAILQGPAAPGERWPRAALDALTRASHWLFSMIDPISGHAPDLGANDGSLLLPLNSAAFGDFRPTVQAAARAFLRTGLPPGPWDELSLWLGLSATHRTAGSDAYMAEHLRGRHSWAYLRASRFPSRLSHMDQLHFDLWWRGLNIAQDPGSYLYSGEPPWDNPLVATRVHNTVTVDGQEQMTRGGRFLTLDWFPAYSKSVLEGDERILGRMVAYHKGYQRLGIRHERTATVFADEHWEIDDRLILTAPGEHVFRLHWLLLDGDWKFMNRESGFELRLKYLSGGLRLYVRQNDRIPNDELRITLARAGELVFGDGRPLPFDGWVSPTYGVKLPALSLAVEITSSRSTSFLSEFEFAAEKYET